MLLELRCHHALVTSIRSPLRENPYTSAQAPSSLAGTPALASGSSEDSGLWECRTLGVQDLRMLEGFS